jgi:hypothetical protein
MLYWPAEAKKLAAGINFQISIQEVLFRITGGTQSILINGFVVFPPLPSMRVYPKYSGLTMYKS